MTVTSQLKSRAEAALQYLQHNDREEEDNDLEKEGLEWAWIYADEDKENINISEQVSTPSRKRKATGALISQDMKKIIGARRGTWEVYIGQPVFLKGERDDDWVAIMSGVVEEDVDDELTAIFQWFAPPAEIRNKARRRTDALPNELYLTAAFDENPLDSINGKPEVWSLRKFNARYPSGKIPRSSRDNGQVFVCRRGCNTRTATYTSEFVWEDVFKGAADLESMKARVERETKATRKRKGNAKLQGKDSGEFIANDDNEDIEPHTPKKRRRLDGEGSKTPRSGRGSKTTPRKLITPTHKRIVTKKPLEFTPLGTRILSPSHLSSPFQLARSQLHVSSVPTSLPCREEEFSTVYSYLESAIIDGTGSCIYISGTPGTGKTATVREVVAQLNASVVAEELDDFIFVEINGMKVTDPHQSYSLLWEAITGDRLSPTHALGLLEREFSTPSPRRVPCVVLMDELDQLVTKNQSVMYNFFNWPNLRHSRLIVLAVANTMDLPERTLSNKISSRLGLTRITFSGYTHEQLIKIIQSRLEGVPGTVVDPDAVQFASRKVAQVSGDARRALDICRRAVEMAETDALAAAARKDDEDDEEESDAIVAPDTPSKRGRESKKSSFKDIISTPRKPPPAGMNAKVTISTIQRAIREATSSPLQQVLRCLPLASKVFLGALSARARRTGVAESVMGEVMDEAKKLSSMSELLPVHDFLLYSSVAAEVVGGAHVAKKIQGRGSSAPRVLAMGNAAMDLVEAGIVMVESRKGERHAKVRLNIGDDEIKLALKDDEEIRGLGFS